MTNHHLQQKSLISHICSMCLVLWQIMRLLEFQYHEFCWAIMLTSIRYFQQITLTFAVIVWLRNNCQTIQSVIVYLSNYQWLVEKFTTISTKVRNSVTASPLVPVLQVTIVPVPIRRVSSQVLRFRPMKGIYLDKYLSLWCQTCPQY